MHGELSEVGRSAPYSLEVVLNQGLKPCLAGDVVVFSEIMHEKTGFPALKHAGAWLLSPWWSSTDDIPGSVDSIKKKA